MVRSPEGLNEADCVLVKKPFPVPHRLSFSMMPFRGLSLLPDDLTLFLKLNPASHGLG
jgi:hypothetical protein